MPDLLYVVARDRVEHYRFLRDHFAQEPAVQVILDRRRTSAAWPADGERRAQSIEAELRSLGWALIPLSWSATPA